MITQFLFNLIMIVARVIFGWLPAVSVLPLGVDSMLQNMVGIWNSFLISFPYGGIAWHYLLYGVFPLEITLLVLKLFLGHRVPVHHDVSNAN
jgi:hypothetical protein